MTNSTLLSSGQGLRKWPVATLDRLPSVCRKAVKEGQINLPSRASFHLSSEVHLMLFHRSKYSKITLESFGVVVLNKILNHSDQTGSVSEAFPVIPFSFQDSPESFHRSVINAFGDPGHALYHAGFGQHTVECAVSILETSVTVTQRVRIRISGNRCPECIKHQRIVVGIPNHIADNSPVIQIQDGAEIYLLYLNTNVVFEFRNIGQPFLVGFVCLEFAIQQIVRQIIRILIWRYLEGRYSNEIYITGIENQRSF